MRRFFLEQLYNPCGQTEGQLDALAERFVTDEAEAQQKYDEATSFGRIPERQRVWDKDIHDTLTTLAKYAAK
jgi:DNA-binding ferritin-like protein